jgi:hypothetical protein
LKSQALFCSLNPKEMAGMDIKAVQQKHQEKLMQLPNVIGVGIGKRGKKKVIKVLVKHKVSMSALLPHERIPKVLDGYETDVEDIGTVTAQIQ